MGGSEVIVALFDCDGTLYAAQMGRGVLEYAKAHGRDRAVRRYYAFLLPYFLLRGLNLISQERLMRPVVANLGWLFQDDDRERVERMFHWVLDDYLMATKRDDVFARLQAHREQGHQVVLVSGMFLPMLEWLGAQVGAAGVIGTRLEVADGRYTGRILPPVMTGANKVPAIRQHVAEREWAIDWEASYAYGDSLHDQGMLRLTGHPTAVYPDPKLHELAQASGWEVIGEPKQPRGMR
jgi:HAD superfamily hydrolase (TIGR01490 family)